MVDLRWEVRSTIERLADDNALAGRMVNDWWRGVGSPARVDLVVDQGVARAAWERLVELWTHADPYEPDPDRALSVVRRPPRTRGSRAPTRSHDVTRVAGHAGSAVLMRLMLQGWQEVARAPGYNVQAATGWPSGGTNPFGAGPTAVVHVMGSPIETGHGDLALQIAQGASAEGGQTILHEELDAGFGPLLSRAGALVRMRDVYAVYRDAALVVLQANPTTGRARNVADRECADYLRIMANELAVIGVPAVLTIPPLPRTDLVVLLPLLAGALLERDTTLSDTLVRTAATLRRTTRSGSLSSKSDRLEAAADVCLYLSPDTDRS